MNVKYFSYSEKNINQLILLESFIKKKVPHNLMGDIIFNKNEKLCIDIIGKLNSFLNKNLTEERKEEIT